MKKKAAVEAPVSAIRPVAEMSEKQILAEKQCVSLKDLAVTGSDLIAEGIEPGPEIGEILQQMLEWVIDDPAMNEKEKLLARWQAVDRVGL